MIINIDQNLAQIIDGQHRIEGIKEAIKIDSSIGEMKIPTTIAMNLDTSRCTEIFISINTEQKTDPKSLIYDLYGLIDSRRDYSIERATDIARILNDDVDSPYEKYIKFPGSRKFKGGIQLSTFVNNLKPLVTIDGEFSKYSQPTLDSQVKILKNFFNALQFYYGDNWFTLKNPFIFASGFGGAVDFFISKILPHESLTTSKGNLEKAFDAFKVNLEKLRKLVRVSTICMHGSPGPHGIAGICGRCMTTEALGSCVSRIWI